MIAQALEGFAGLASLQKQPQRAFHLAGAASTLRHAMGAPLPPQWQHELDQRLQPARVLMGEPASRAAFDDGAAWLLDAAIAYALQEAGEARALARLTAREREVALLAARGLRNRQIADALFISPETAALHVKHILAKLEFHSRAQLAIWMTTQTSGRTLAADDVGVPIVRSKR